MATVYKIEVEIVSDWVNYTEADIEEMIKEAVEAIRRSKIKVSHIKCISRTWVIYYLYSMLLCVLMHL